MADFCDTTLFKYFNINNLWINIPALLKKEKIELDLIINPKTVENIPIIQLEVAAGAAIACFRAAGLGVPRTRFRPVKKSGDLMLVQSDCFRVDEAYRLV